MVLVNTSLSQQEQAASAGVSSYPQIGQVKKDSIIIEEFSRETLNPTNGYEVYTTAGTGTETISIINASQLRMTTGGTLGNDASVRTSGISFERTARNLENRSSIELDIIFNQQTGDLADSEMFIGFLESTSALTALPTTDRHLGIYIDRSTANDYLLTSANGSTQSTTSTGQAGTNSAQRINIIWNGDNSATITLYQGTTFSTQVAQQTVTSLDMAARAFLLHFYIETEAGAAKAMNIFEWKVKTE